MENFRLKVFRTVADNLNFRQAAEALYLTQPAVTLQIKALEEELGVAPLWFGAKFPDQVKSVEFVFVAVTADGHPLYSYQEYEGAPPKRVTPQEGRTPGDRGVYLLSQRAAVMP